MKCQKCYLKTCEKTLSELLYQQNWNKMKGIICDQSPFDGYVCFKLVENALIPRQLTE